MMCLMKKGKVPEMEAALLEAAKSGDLVLRTEVSTKSDRKSSVTSAAHR